MTERLLIVRDGTWTRGWNGRLNGRRSAGAVFRRLPSASPGSTDWRCVAAVPPLLSFIGMPMEDIRSVLEERRFTWHWATRFTL